MDTAQNKAVVEEFDRLGNRGGDLSRLDALCMPNMVNYALAPGRPPGLEGTREYLGLLSVIFTMPDGWSTSASPKTTWLCSSARASITGPAAGSADSTLPRAPTSGTRPLPTGSWPDVSPNAGRSAMTSQCCSTRCDSSTGLDHIALRSRWAGHGHAPRDSGARLGLDADRPFVRPDISPVGADRTRVMRCGRLLLSAVGCCCCCHRCCQPLVLVPISEVSPALCPRPVLSRPPPPNPIAAVNTPTAGSGEDTRTSNRMPLPPVTRGLRDRSVSLETV